MWARTFHRICGRNVEKKGKNHYESDHALSPEPEPLIENAEENNQGNRKKTSTVKKLLKFLSPKKKSGVNFDVQLEKGAVGKSLEDVYQAQRRIEESFENDFAQLSLSSPDIPGVQKTQKMSENYNETVFPPQSRSVSPAFVIEPSVSQRQTAEEQETIVDVESGENIQRSANCERQHFSAMERLNIQKSIRSAVRHLPSPTNDSYDLLRFVECAEREFKNFLPQMLVDQSLTQLFIQALIQRLQHPAYSKPKAVVENFGLSVMQEKAENPLVRWPPNALQQPYCSAARTKQWKSLEEFRQFLHDEKLMEDRKNFVWERKSDLLRAAFLCSNGNHEPFDPGGIQDDTKTIDTKTSSEKRSCVWERNSSIESVSYLQQFLHAEKMRENKMTHIMNCNDEPPVSNGDHAELRTEEIMNVERLSQHIKEMNELKLHKTHLQTMEKMTTDNETTLTLSMSAIAVVFLMVLVMCCRR
jgi:hypothetical protein